MVPLRNSQDLSSSPVYTAVLIPAVKQKPRGSLIQQHQATEPQQPVDEPFSMLRSRPIPIKRKATA